jgi:peptidoglycan hydrolase-like protein with peptidoglycan-binding domain
VLIDELIAKLRYGQRSEDVRTLQSELKRLGYLPASLKVTTYYGPLTRGAVNAYLAQIDVASIDIDALIAELKFGMSSSKVTLLQRALQVRGYFSAKVRVTAYYGTITRAAVNAYLAAK